MMIFAAVYLYFLIQVIMASKWKDSDFIVNEMKEKMNLIPSMVESWAKNVKNKVSDESVIVIEKVKGITKKAWETIKEWKDYVIDKCKNIKSKLKSTKSTATKEVKSKWLNYDEKSIWDLVKANKELIDLTKQLIDKYDKSLKLLEEINKKLSKKK